MKKMQNRIPSLDDFCEIKKDEDGKPQVFIEPRLALVLDGLSKRFAQTLFQSFKMSNLQGLGASAKLDKGLKAAFAKDIINEKMPWLSALEHFAGINVKSYITKNPDAALSLLSNPKVQQIIGGFMNRNNSPGQSHNQGQNVM